MYTARTHWTLHIEKLNVNTFTELSLNIVLNWAFWGGGGSYLFITQRFLSLTVILIDQFNCFHAKPKNSRKTPYLSYLTGILGIRCSHDYFHSSAWFHLFPGIRRFSDFSEILDYRFVGTGIISFSFYFWFFMKTSESREWHSNISLLMFNPKAIILPPPLFKVCLWEKKLEIILNSKPFTCYLNKNLEDIEFFLS